MVMIAIIERIIRVKSICGARAFIAPTFVLAYPGVTGSGNRVLSLAYGKITDLRQSPNLFIKIPAG